MKDLNAWTTLLDSQGIDYQVNFVEHAGMAFLHIGHVIISFTYDGDYVNIV